MRTTKVCKCASPSSDSFNFFSPLLNKQDRPDIPRVMALDMIGAGADTTGTSLGWLLYCLSRDQVSEGEERRREGEEGERRGGRGRGERRGGGGEERGEREREREREREKLCPFFLFFGDQCNGLVPL